MTCERQGCRSRKSAKLRANGMKLCDKCDNGNDNDDRINDSTIADTEVTDTHTATIQQVPIVVNEVLSYCAYYMHSSTRDAIKRVVLDFYNPEEISYAKRTLWDSLGSEFLGNTKSRQDSHIRFAHECEIDDILNALAKIDADQSDSEGHVHFVAYDLGRLPRVAPEELDVSSLALRLIDLEHKYKSLESKVAKNSDNVALAMDINLQTTGYANAARRHVPNTTPGQVISRPTQKPPHPPRPPPVAQDDTNVNTALNAEPTSSDASGSAAISASRNSPSPAASGSSSSSDSGGFQLQREERRRLAKRTSRQPVYGSSESVSALRAGKRHRDLFVFNLDADTTGEGLKKFLLDSEITAEEVECQSKDNSFNKSFRLKVDSVDADKLLKPEFWPARVGIRPFFRKRVQRNTESNQNEH